MGISALIVGIVLAAGGSYVEARYVARRRHQRFLPAIGHPNIHNWNWLPDGVPRRVLLLRFGCLVAGLSLIGTAVEDLGPTWWWAGMLTFLTAAPGPR